MPRLPIDPNLKFRRKAILAVQAIKNERPWAGSLANRKKKFDRLLKRLSIAYEIEKPRLKTINMTGRGPEHSNYNGHTHTITLEGKMSVLTVLHEFKHALDAKRRRRITERSARKWSINLYHRVFPEQTVNLVFDGILLTRSQAPITGRDRARPDLIPTRIKREDGVVQTYHVKRNFVVVAPHTVSLRSDRNTEQLAQTIATGLGGRALIAEVSRTRLDMNSYQGLTTDYWKKIGTALGTSGYLINIHGMKEREHYPKVIVGARDYPDSVFADRFAKNLTREGINTRAVFPEVIPVSPFGPGGDGLIRHFGFSPLVHAISIEAQPDIRRDYQTTGPKIVMAIKKTVEELTREIQS